MVFTVFVTMLKSIRGLFEMSSVESRVEYQGFGIKDQASLNDGSIASSNLSIYRTASSISLHRSNLSIYGTAGSIFLHVIAEVSISLMNRGKV